MKIDLIVTGSKPSRLIAQAAKELAKYAHELFGHKPRVAVRPGKTRGITILLDAKAKGFSDQGYALSPIDRHTFEIAGGSPIAVMWGVYDLIERWGVRYELHGDILPNRPGAMTLPGKAIVCEPDLKLRSFRTYNDFAQNECCWAAKDYELLLNQLVKMRYNGIMFCVRPYDPFIDLRFHGARKTLAAPNFGWEPKVLSHHPGYELFEQSGDAKRGVFVNPDLTGHDSHDKATAAGRAYARKVFRMAHARGITCAVSAWCADFDPAIRKRILELTLPKHKVKRSEAVRICYGIWREGPDVETGRCMSIKNPVFLDAIATNMQAHIDAFPDADRFTFSSTEFGGSDADCERAWKTLDRKYGLNKINTLPALQKEARATAEDDADRSERELRSDIVILQVLDQLINERGFDLSRSRKGCSVMLGSLAAGLHQFLPSIFPYGSQFTAGYGYMPAYVATRTSTLKQKDPEAIRYSLVISAEDDNVGMLPQLTGPAVHQIIEALRTVGAYGFQTRQWGHSNLLPTFHYMGHAAWEKGWTPAKAYKHLYEPICGKRSVEHILKAYRRIERATERMHLDVFCVSFPVPNWITNFWDNWPETHTPQRLELIARQYEQSANDLANAVDSSRTAGRDCLYAMERHVRHGVYYCRSLAELGRAYIADRDTTPAVEAKDFARLDKAHQAAMVHSANAESLMRQACETFAQGVRDRCDLGALVVLNSSNLDMVSAIARLTRAKGEMYSCRES